MRKALLQDPRSRRVGRKRAVCWAVLIVVMSGVCPVLAHAEAGDQPATVFARAPHHTHGGQNACDASDCCDVTLGTKRERVPTHLNLALGAPHTPPAVMSMEGPAMAGAFAVTTEPPPGTAPPLPIRC